LTEKGIKRAEKRAERSTRRERKMTERKMGQYAFIRSMGYAILECGVKIDGKKGASARKATERKTGSMHLFEKWEARFRIDGKRAEKRVRRTRKVTEEG
jgi:hypothetical protein